MKRLAPLFALSIALISANAEEAPLRGTPIASISLKDVHVGTPEIDLRLLESYGPVPNELREFFIQARAVFESEEPVTFEHPSVLQAAADHNRALLGGPMLGELSATGVSIWLRPATTASLTITVKATDGSPAEELEHTSVVAGAVLNTHFSNLNPSTAYTYSVDSEGATLAQGSFSTAPLDEHSGSYTIAFGADFHKIGQHNPQLFDNILERDPSVMLLLGDSAADDRRANMNLHRADYFSRDTSPSWSKFAAHVPSYAIWDDHDYFDDDLSGLQDGLFKESDREAIRAVWKENWNNPATPEGHQGIYFNTRLGPVEVFMLDTRSCRDWKIRGQYGSYLGAQQQQWLLEGLRSSTAPFKLLASGTMWSDYISNGKDSWTVWDPEALEEIFSLIEDEQIGGVILLSGDRHGARGFRIPRESGYGFVELGVGSLGGIHGPPAMAEDPTHQLFGYDGQGFSAFGEFNFDTSREHPVVTFRLISESGTILEEHSWTESELTPGSHD